MATQRKVHQPRGGGNVPAPNTGKTRYDLVQITLDSKLAEFGAATKAIGLPPEVFIQAVLNSCRKTPKLLECSLPSLLKCAMDCAQLGLVPDDPRSQCHLIPYAGEATLQIGYKGLIQLARRGGQVLGVNAEVVYENEFAHPGFILDLGVERRLVHIPLPPSKRGPEIVGAYATTSHPGPSGVMREFTWMWLEDIEAIRQATKSRNKGRESPAWRDADTYPEMLKKTALKRLLKYADQSTNTQRAIYLDDRLEMGLSQTMADATPTQKAEAATEEQMEAMRRELDQEKPPPEPNDDIEVDPATGEVVPPPGEICPGCGAHISMCQCPPPNDD